MVAVAAARLADTALPSAALSGCWRISIKAQYLDTSKGSDVTAATQDLLLHLHQHAASPHIYYHTGKKTEPQRPEVTAKTHKRRRSSAKASVRTRGGPLSHLPVLGSFPVITAFTSSLLKGFAPRTFREPLAHPSIIWVFWKLPKIVKSWNNTHQHSDT